MMPLILKSIFQWFSPSSPHAIKAVVARRYRASIQATEVANRVSKRRVSCPAPLVPLNSARVNTHAHWSDSRRIMSWRRSPGVTPRSDWSKSVTNRNPTWRARAMRRAANSSKIPKTGYNVLKT